jgi:hypothetical protein
MFLSRYALYCAIASVVKLDEQVFSACLERTYGRKRGSWKELPRSCPGQGPANLARTAPRSCPLLVCNLRTTPTRSGITAQPPPADEACPATPGLLQRRSWDGTTPSGTETTPTTGPPARRLGHTRGSEGGRPGGTGQHGRLRPPPSPASSAPASWALALE